MNDKEKLLELINSIDDTDINDILPIIYQHFNLDDNFNAYKLNEQAQRYILNESHLDNYMETTDYETKKALLREKIENGFREIAEGKGEPARKVLADIEREIFGWKNLKLLFLNKQKKN